MKEVRSLCVNFLLLMLADAVPHKLIPGEKSVVKSGGATHHLTKYYLVPNDYDPNKATDGTGVHKALLDVNNNRYSKSMDLEMMNNEQVNVMRNGALNHRQDEYNIAVNNNGVNFDTSLTKADAEVEKQSNKNVESSVSVNTQPYLEPYDDGNLEVLVKPINNSHNTENATGNGTNLHNAGEVFNIGNNFSSNTAENQEMQWNDQLDKDKFNLILIRFDEAVHESVSQNIDSYWKLIRYYIDSITDEDKVLAKIRRLSPLLDIFTNLYKATQSETTATVELKIDHLLDILKKPQVEPNVSEDHDKTECIKICSKKYSHPHSDSKSKHFLNLNEVNLIEKNNVGVPNWYNLRPSIVVPQNSKTDGQVENDADFPKTNKEYDDFKRKDFDPQFQMPSSDPSSTEVVRSSSHQPIDILPSQLVRPDTLIEKNIVGVPDRYHLRPLTVVPQISETDGQVENNADFLKRDNEYDDFDRDDFDPQFQMPSSDPGSIEIVRSSSHQPIDILQSQLVRPDNLIEKGMPDGYNLRPSTVVPQILETEGQVENNADFKKIDNEYNNFEPDDFDPQFQMPSSDPGSIEIVRSSSHQPIDILQSQLVRPHNLIEKNNVGMPDGYNSRPSIRVLEFNNPEDATSKQQIPDPAEGINIKDLPPITYPSDDQGLSTNENKIILDANQSPVSITVDGVIKDRFRTPYYAYKYVRNSTSVLYKKPKTSNIEVIPKQYNTDPKTELGSEYDLSAPQDINKVVYINEPSSGYYESEIGALTRPSIPHSMSSNPKFEFGDIDGLKVYESPATNPDSLLPETSQVYPDIAGFGKTTNSNPKMISPEFQIYLEPENKRIVQEPSSNDEILRPNISSAKFVAVNNLDTTDVPSEVMFPNIKPNYYDLYTDLLPEVPSYESESIKPSVYDRKINNGANFLIYNQLHNLERYIKKPNLITYLQGKRPTRLDHIQQLKLNLAPTYQLFALENLMRLHSALVQNKQRNVLNIYGARALANLRRIVFILLKLADHLGEYDGQNEWYTNIFYSVQQQRHPLHLYVYKLLRQKWLHELMLALYKNNFNLTILNNPRIYLFLAEWRFPNYVQSFLEAEEREVDVPNAFEKPISKGNVLQDHIPTTPQNLEETIETPDLLENYITKNVFDTDLNTTPNQDINSRVTVVDVDANAIVEVLRKYWNYKSFIEKQEEVIIRNNRTEMLKQIILYLREKGYGPIIIADLIRKLYVTVYSYESKACHAPLTRFAKNAYDLILPILRRSGY